MINLQVKRERTRNTWTCTNWKPTRISRTPVCMLSLGLTNNEMELGFTSTNLGFVG